LTQGLHIELIQKILPDKKSTIEAVVYYERNRQPGF
jgi:hypothetical protein